MAPGHPLRGFPHRAGQAICRRRCTQDPKVQARAQCYKTFYGRNLQMFLISVCLVRPS
jgi:hypothetical protein